MALEGLLIVLDGIEKHCRRRISDIVPQPPIYSSSNKCAILPYSPGVQPPIMSKYLIAGSCMDNNGNKYMAMTSEDHHRQLGGAIWRGVCNHLHRMKSASARTLDTQLQLEW